MKTLICITSLILSTSSLADTSKLNYHNDLTKTENQLLEQSESKKDTNMFSKRSKKSKNLAQTEENLRKANELAANNGNFSDTKNVNGRIIPPKSEESTLDYQVIPPTERLS